MKINRRISTRMYPSEFFKINSFATSIQSQLIDNSNNRNCMALSSCLWILLCDCNRRVFIDKVTGGFSRR